MCLWFSVGESPNLLVDILQRRTSTERLRVSLGTPLKTRKVQHVPLERKKKKKSERASGSEEEITDSYFFTKVEKRKRTLESNDKEKTKTARARASEREREIKEAAAAR